MKSGISLKLKNLIVLLVLFLISNQIVAQNNGGIFFQAVARDNYSNPAKYRKIYIQSSIIQSTINGNKVLIEEHQANTDATGMFSISIGNGTREGGSATGLSAIDWSNGPFYLNLKVAITPLSGVNGWDYTKEWLDMGTTSFGAVPYALYAENAAGVNQKLSLTDTTKMLSVYAKAQAVQNLATTVNTKLSFSDTASMLNPYVRASLVLDSAYINTELKSKADTADVNTALNLKANTADVNTVLNLKANTADVNTALNLKANTSDVTSSLDLKANTTDVNTSLANKVDKVTGKELSTNDFTTAEKTKLAAIAGTNTGDQDLSALATNTALNLKANTADVTTSLVTKVDKVTGKDLSTNDYTTAEKTKLAAITGTNTGDQDLSALATNTALALKANTTDVTSSLNLKANTADVTSSLNLKANTADVTTSLATKVDKVTGKDLSTNDYTTAEKTKLAAITGTNTGDQDLSALATNTALALKANTTDVNTSLNLKANTADVTTSLDLKANTADVTTSLATKVDKVTGKDLSTNDYTTAEKTKLAAITGTNTGDQTTITGNAGTATKLAASKTINGVAFDGSVDITVNADAGTLTGTTLASNVVNSSLTSVGTITSGVWSGTTIAVANGGTGTTNGSITGTSALTFEAGGTNQNISIKPSGTGSVFVGSGTITPTSSSAILEASSTTQGFLPPRLTTTQRDAITAPVEGLTIWNKTNAQLEVYDGSYWRNMLGILVSPIKVGDTLGGGIVFYIFNTTDIGFIKGQTHGLIAAFEDQTDSTKGIRWFPDKYYGATGTYIGLGLPNTLSIIISAELTGTTNRSSYAAGLANSYRGGGYMDWYLPSKDELNLLWQHREAVGGFVTLTSKPPGNIPPSYWSSTQKGTLNFTKFEDFAKGVTNARIQVFYDVKDNNGNVTNPAGTITDLGINNPRHVRAIRIF